MTAYIEELKEIRKSLLEILGRIDVILNAFDEDPETQLQARLKLFLKRCKSDSKKFLFFPPQKENSPKNNANKDSAPQCDQKIQYPPSQGGEAQEVQS